MAITRIWQTGWESGSTSEVTSEVGGYTVNAVSARTGSYSIYGYPANSNWYFIQTFPGTRQVRLGCGWLKTDDGTIEGQLISIRDSSGVLIQLNLINSTTNLRLKVGGSNVDITTDSPVFQSNIWYHIGIDCKIDSSSGWAYVYLNGTNVLSYSGNTGNTDLERIDFGTYTAQGGTVQIHRWDDLYLDDTTGESSPTSPELKKFYPLTPNGDGNYKQWNPTGSSHYNLVDERPPGADYVYAITGSLYDSYNMSTFTLDVNENIIAMIPYVIAKRDYSTEQIALGTRSSGTDLVGSDQDLSLSYDYYWERQITGSMGSSWDQSYLDSVEVVIKSAGTY